MELNKLRIFIYRRLSIKHAVENQFVVLSRVNLDINPGLKAVIVDPDKELIYTKRKIVNRETNSSRDTVSGTSDTSTDSQRHEKVNYPARR